MKITKLLLITSFLYVLLLFIFIYTGYREEIPAFKFVIQIVFSLTLFTLLFVTHQCKLNINVILVFTFIFSFVSSFILRQCYLEFMGIPFETAENDGFAYNKLAVNGIRESYNDYIQYIFKTTRYNIDDLGFPTVLYIIYNIAGEEHSALYLVLLFNAFFVVISTNYLYKIMLMLNIQHNYARFFSSVWGYFPYFVSIAVQNRKENIFCMFIVLAFYNIFKFRQSYKLYYLVFGSLFLLSCFFFRTVVSAMMFLCFIVLFIVKFKNRKIIRNVLVAGFIMGIISIGIILEYIFDLPLDTLLAVSQYRLGGESANLSFMWLTQILSGFIGPFPNFSRAVQDGITYNGGLLLNVMFSFPFLIGIWHIFKKLEHKYYPVALYICMGLLMLILSAVALDMRYQMTFFPLALCVIAYAFHRKINRLLYYGYIVSSVALVVVYNFR